MNLYQKLIEIRKSVDYLQKSNKGYQFSYVSSSQVLVTLRDKMNEYGVLLVPEVNHGTYTLEGRKSGNAANEKTTWEYFTELFMKFTWVNAENPEERIVCPFYAQGVDNGEKGTGKALTYGEKFFLLKFFNIPTDKDDPDAIANKFPEGGKKPVKKVTPKPAPKKPAPKPVVRTQEELLAAAAVKIKEAKDHATLDGIREYASKAITDKNNKENLLALISEKRLTLKE